MNKTKLSNDLSTDEELRHACQEIDNNYFRSGLKDHWRNELVDFLTRITEADEVTRASIEFQKEIWEKNPISAVGMGTVNVDKAISDKEFREWLAKQSLQPIPESYDKQAQFFAKFYAQLTERLEPFSNRTPRLKIFRVLAAFYPDYFTTIAHAKKAKRLTKVMFGEDENPVVRHLAIRRRLNEVLGPTPSDWNGRVYRLMLSWFLYTETEPTDEEIITKTVTDIPGEEKLIPLPAARRRRGMTAMAGGFNSIMGALEFARDGVTGEGLKVYLKAQNPELKDSSLNTQVYILMGEFGVIRRDGDSYVLTERGETILESGDASDLADWIITRILGTDHAIAYLRDHGDTPPQELLGIVQKANPGWTTKYIPSSVIWWLRQLGVIEADQAGIHSLTDEGRNWAKLISWTPENLEKEVDATETVSKDTKILPSPNEQDILLPDVDTICDHVTSLGAFDRTLITKLHVGLWANKIRHFAVLTGLSGSGKTLLAKAYASSLHKNIDKESNINYQIIAVQPGWYDPSPLLGYVNPLRPDTYIRTPFLDFLLRASGEHQIPYMVVLDEMNLSRPEQYLAPLLSAMETEAPIDLHREQDLLDGIPPSIPYPANLAIIGTVNMDETTHGLSDKILDRAFTLEFWNIDLDSYPHWGKRDLEGETEQQVRTLLSELMVALQPARLHFGWRTVDDVLDYMTLIQGATSIKTTEALDSVIYAKVLPKFRGDDSPRFNQALSDCVDVLKKHSLTASSSKLYELKIDLEHTGSARFWR